MINSIVTSFIVFLLDRFAFDFTEDQRDRIQEVLSENQPIWYYYRIPKIIKPLNYLIVN